MVAVDYRQDFTPERLKLAISQYRGQTGHFPTSKGGHSEFFKIGWKAIDRRMTDGAKQNLWKDEATLSRFTKKHFATKTATVAVEVVEKQETREADLAKLLKDLGRSKLDGMLDLVCDPPFLAMVKILVPLIGTRSKAEVLAEVDSYLAFHEAYSK